MANTVSPARLSSVTEVKPPSTSVSFRFFDLPLEIRLSTYEFDLDNRRAETCCASLVLHNRNTAAVCKSRQQPPLAKTCRQMRHEALPIYYGNTMFELVFDGFGGDIFYSCSGRRDTEMWLSGIGRGNVKKIEAYLNACKGVRRSICDVDWDLLQGKALGAAYVNGAILHTSTSSVMDR